MQSVSDIDQHTTNKKQL